MQPVAISATAATISALSALTTIYFNRSQNKGFVWAKDPKIHLRPLPDGGIHLALEIPLFNLGAGRIRFKTLKVKKVYLKTNSIEPFEQDMDEAYFPPGVPIIAYKTPIYSDIKPSVTKSLPTTIQVYGPDVTSSGESSEAIQEEINRKLKEFGEVLIILKCEFIDGSWFGLKTRSITIGFSLQGLDLNYLSVTRRKELDKLFK